MRAFLSKRSLKYGSNTFVLIGIVLAVVAMVNFVSTRHHSRFDVTQGNLYSLSDQTVGVLKNLSKDVHVLAFYRDGGGQELRDRLQEYAYRSDQFSFEFVDPDKSPEKAKQYGIRSYQTIVVLGGNKEEKLTEDTEKELTNAILKVTREGNKAIYFVEGHGENRTDDADKEGYSYVKKALEEANYDVNTVLLAQRGGVPDDCAILVVSGAQRTFLSNEIEMIETYIQQGGDVFLLFDPGVDTGLETLVAQWGVQVGRDVVVDVSGIGRLFGIGGVGTPIAGEYGAHPITEKHKGTMTFFPLSRSVSFDGGGRTDVTGTELAKTSSSSWAENDPNVLSGGEVSRGPGEQGGPISLSVAVTVAIQGEDTSDEDTEQEQARLVVFGDSDFAKNGYFPQQGNGDLFLNCISWLAEEEELISIRPKEAGFNPITLTKAQGRNLFLLSVILLPLLVLVVGTVVYVRRK
ncbi:MAG: GldG family protein [Candidatus Latescibacterota bacterium]